jgi:hypothetical protein
VRADLGEHLVAVAVEQGDDVGEPDGLTQVAVPVVGVKPGGVDDAAVDRRVKGPLPTTPG